MTDDVFGGQENVVAMKAAIGEAQVFPVLTEMEEYWSTLRGARVVPARSEIEPRRIGKALQYAFILERLAPTVARFRLAGMHLNDLLGMEVRGMPLTAFFLPEARKQIGTALEEVFGTPSIARFQLRGDRGIGKPPLDAQLLLLPLRSDLGEISRVLGCLVTLGPVGRTPRRFDIKASRISPLLTAPAAMSEDATDWARVPMSGKSTLQEMAESQAPFATRQPAPAAQAPRPPRAEDGTRPHLYLVKSDE